jgi:hypothetical protein
MQALVDEFSISKQTNSNLQNTWMLRSMNCQHSKSRSLKESKTDFHKLVHDALDFSLCPYLNFANARVRSFLFNEQFIQNHLDVYRDVMLCIDSFGTQLFFKGLEKEDLKDNWRLTSLLHKCLGESVSLRGNFEVELNHGEKFIFYNAPWPTNQILTRTIQHRYNLIFRFLKTLHHAVVTLNERRLEKKLVSNRLHLLSFLNSMLTFAMQSVIIPAVKAADWKTAQSVDHLLDMQENLLKLIETKLYLHVFYCNVASIYIAFCLGVFRAL